MTVQNPPIFIQAGSHPAEDVRRWMDAMVESNPGVVGATDLEVTEKSGTPNMSVDVAGGRAFIAGDEATYQGMYAVENRGTTNLTISASDPTNPRIDLVVARIKDSAYSGASDTFSLEVVTGTPAASPSAPTIPDNCLLLATVAVAALATSITDANITDNRTRAYALGVADTKLDLSQRGSMGIVTKTSSQAGIVGTLVDVTGVSVTWEAVAGRVYDFTVITGALSTVANDILGLYIVDNVEGQLQQSNWIMPTGGNVATAMSSVRMTSMTPGTHTTKLQAIRNGGTGSLTIFAAAGYKTQLAITAL